LALQRAAFVALLAVAPMAPYSAAQSPGPPREAAETKVDYDSARREIQQLETVINGLLKETFINPFGLVNRTKGAYIPGYGQVFNFLVNIERAVISTPFGEYRSGPTITTGEKKQRIEDLKDRLVRVLLDNASGMRQLRAGESVTIVAFFEDRNFPEEERQNRTVVLSALKKDLDEWSARPERWKEFKQRMKIVEY